MHIEIDYGRMSPPATPIDIITLNENLVVEGEVIPLRKWGMEQRFEVETTEHIWGEL